MRTLKVKLILLQNLSSDGNKISGEKNKKNLINFFFRIKRYFNFERMLTEENMSDILPWCNDVDTGVKYYLSLYKNYNEREYPVLAIFIN